MRSSGFKFRSRLVLPIAILSIVATIVIAGFVFRWHLIIQYVVLLRFLKWVCVAIYTIVPVFIVGHWFGKKILRFYSQCSESWSIIISWILGCSIFIVAGMILLAIGLYSAIFWIISSLLLNLGIIFWLFKKRWQPVKSFFRNSLPIVIKDIAGEKVKIWNVLILIILALAMLRAMVPPGATDELMYHLAIPRLWEIQGDWWVSSDNYHLLFPANIEIMWGYSLAVGGLHIPRLITFLFGLMTVLFMWRWQKDLLLDPWIRVVSILFFLITPLAVVTLALNYVEWPMLLCIYSGWWASRQYIKTRERSYILLVAICWGITLGIKYSAILVIFLLALEWMIEIARGLSKRDIFIAFFSLLIGGFIFLCPWLYRNHMLSGDPIFPMGSIISKHKYEGNKDGLFEVKYLMRYEDLKGMWRWNPWLYHACVDDVSDNRMHFGWPLLHLFVLIIGWKIFGKKPWLTVFVLSIILFYYTPSPRIYFPLMGLTWLFLPGYLKSFICNNFRRIILTGLMILLMIPSIPMIYHACFLSYNKASQEYVLGFIYDNTFLHKINRVTPIMEWIWEKTPKSSRLWAWGESDIFYFNRWTKPSSPYDLPAFITILERKGIEGLSREIKRDRIDYVIINTSRCNLASRTIHTLKKIEKIPKNIYQQLTFWMGKNLRLIGKDRIYELYKVLE